MWKQILSITLLIFMTFGLMMQDAEAKRFGGGRSFGMSRSSSSFSKSASSNNFSSAANRTSGFAKRWAGPVLAGLAGGLIASLLMQHGLMGGLMTWLAIGAVLMLLVQFIRSRMQPQAAHYQRQGHSQDNVRSAAAQFMHNASRTTSAPADFDKAIFVREAKSLFIRMQTAYDDKNLSDIREFTTPEVYAEIQLQIQERGQAANATHVLSVEAELLDVETEQQATITSVRFSGLIQEERNQAAEQINEVWHFKNTGVGGKWLIAGVQQN